MSDLARDVGAFLTDRQARGLSPRTVDFHRDELANLAKFLKQQGITETRAITPTHLRAFLLDLGKRRKPGGTHAAYRAARAFLKWYEAECEPDGWTNPIRKVSAPRVPQEVLQPANLAHVKAMLETCRRRTFMGDRDRAILLSLLDSGLQASEFLALNLDDMSLDTGAVVVRRGKGGKFRAAFLGHKAQRATLDYLRYRKDTAGASPLWMTCGGERLTYWGLRQILRRRAERAGVPAPSPHDFRRAFALIALRNGVDLISLQRLLGHSDLSVIRRYLAQTEGNLQAAHAKASPVDKWL